MDRRDFVKSTVAGGGIVILSSFSGCEQAPVKNNSVAVNLYSAFDMDEVTVDQLQKSMKNGETSSEEVVSKYLKRIEDYDKKGPELRAIIEINPDALTIARGLDNERKKGIIRGPLHGIPVVIKDNIDTGDKMQTTAGSLALEGFHAPQDAFIINKLRNAGAVVLAKANLSEWANIRSNHSSSGWSGRGGQAKNPYDITRNPCGSSSGSAIAAAVNFTTLAIGTETDGSIVCPSGMNGIVGIKPTLGLWSRNGIIPISHSQDTAGPMARTVKDAVYLLAALQGKDDYDPATAYIPSDLTDYSQCFDPEGLKGARIGVIRDFMGFHPGVDQLMEDIFNQMKKLGAVLSDVNCATDRKRWSDAEWTVLLYELKADLNKYLAKHPGAPMKSLQDIIDFNNKNKEKEMPWFGQGIFLSAEKKGNLNEKEYLDALKLSKTLTREILNQTFNQNKLDACIVPTNAPAWKTDLVDGDHDIGGTSDLAAISGYPSITVPAGSVHGLPVGASFIGKAWSESTLIRLAYSFEQGSKRRFKPTGHDVI